MLPRVSVHEFCCAPFTNVENYRRIVGDELIDEIESLGRELNGVRVFWKGRPLVAGRAGGIPMQFPPGYDRYLVDGVEDCAARMVELLGDPALRRSFGEAAREHVRRSYLLPRLLRDELRLMTAVLREGAR